MTNMLQSRKRYSSGKELLLTKTDVVVAENSVQIARAARSLIPRIPCNEALFLAFHYSDWMIL